MSNSEWKLVRKEQHGAIPEMAFALEVNIHTLEFRLQINGQTFSGKDGAEVVSRAGAYLRSLPVPGNWQLMIELARYSDRMEASRCYFRVEDNGAVVRHPWVASAADITLLQITELRYHCGALARGQKGIPPCMHNDGLSTYYHLPYTPQVWEAAQEVAATFNGFCVRLSAFLTTVSTPTQDWPAHFLQQWERFPLALDGRQNAQEGERRHGV